MGISVVGIFNAAVDQAQKSAQNLQAIREARIKRQQEQQMFDLKKKKMELDIQASELKGENTAIQNRIQQSMFDEYTKQQKSIFDGQNAQIDQVEHTEMQKGTQAGNVAKTLFRTSPDVQSFVAYNINPSLGLHPGLNPMGTKESGVMQGQDTEGRATPEAVPSAFDNMPDTVLAPTIKDGKMVYQKGKPEDLQFKRIDALKKKGAPILPDEARFHAEYEFKKKHPKYNRGEVLKMARQLAIDESTTGKIKGTANPQSIKFNIPKAEEMLYGESMPQYQDPNPEKNYGGVSPIPMKKDNKAQAKSSVKEGTIAVNKKTGQKLIFTGGKWQNKP